MHSQQVFDRTRFLHRMALTSMIPQRIIVTNQPIRKNGCDYKGRKTPVITARPLSLPLHAPCAARRDLW